MSSTTGRRLPVGCLISALLLFLAGSVASVVSTLFSSEAAFADEISFSMFYLDSRDESHSALTTPANFHFTTSINGSVTLQVSYHTPELDHDYAVGAVSFRVYGLERFGVEKSTISAGTFSYSHHQGTYNPVTNLVENDYYTFTSRNKYTQGTSLDGSVQIAYKFNDSSGSPYNHSSGDVWCEYQGESTNTLSFSFELEKKTYTMSVIRGDKLSSYSGLGDNAEDYYWVRYTHTYSGSSNVLGTSGLYYVVIVPDDCVALAQKSGQVLATPDIEYEDSANGVIAYRISTSGFGPFIVGYPKDTYRGQTADHYVELHGQYKIKPSSSDLLEDPVLLAEAEKTGIVLDNYEVNESGEIFSYRTYDSRATRLTYGTVMASDRYATASYSTCWLINGSKIGFPYDIEEHFDRIGIAIPVCEEYPNGGYVELDDSNILITKIVLPTDVLDPNENPVYLLEGNENARVELFVRTAGSASFTQYGTYELGRSETTIELDEDDNVVEFYYRMTNLVSSIETARMCRAASSTFRIHDIDFTIPDNSKLSMLVYADLLKHSDQTSLIAPLTAYGEPFYMGGGRTYPSKYDDMRSDKQYLAVQKKAIYDADMAEYGAPKYRGSEQLDFVSGLYHCKMNLDNSNGTRNDAGGYTDYSINFTPGYGGSTTTTPKIYADKFLIEIPRIFTVDMNIDNLKQRMYNAIVDSASNSKWGSIDYSHQHANKVELANYILDHIVYAAFEPKNDGSGNTFLRLEFDFNNDPLIIPFVDANRIDWFKIPLPVRIYDVDVLDYGGAFRLQAYEWPTIDTGDRVSEGSGGNAPSSNNRLFTSGGYNGMSFEDAYDLNENGNVTEKIPGAYGAGLIVPAFSSEFSLSKLAETDLNTFKIGASNVSASEDYTYRLRIRSAASGISNLVIYDPIECFGEQVEAGHWKGSFNGVDLQRSQSQGHVPSVYYSTEKVTSDNAESLTWYPYDSSVNNATVVSLKFDYGNQIIQPGSVVSVDIKMTAPSSNQDTYAYNSFFMTGDQFDVVTETDIGDYNAVSPKTILSVGGNISDEVMLPYSKSWANEPDGFTGRPSSVNIHLLRDDEILINRTLNNSNGWSGTFTSLARFDEDDCHEYVYTVTEDPVSGYVANITGGNIVNTYVGHPGISVIKTVNNTDAVVGDTLTYTITVENTGDVGLQDVTVDDEMLGMTAAPVASTLAPGATATITGTYTTVQSDATTGNVVNVASVHSTSMISTGMNVTATSNTVVTMVSDPLEMPMTGMSGFSVDNVIILLILGLIGACVFVTDGRKIARRHRKS